MSKTNEIRVALIGFGHLGKWHAQKVEKLEDSKLVAIVDNLPEKMDLASQQYPKALVVSDIREVIDNIDAAIVSAPTTLHFDLVTYLLENKKHVFCEKPLASTYEEAKKIAQLEEGLGVVVQVGHSERFHEAWDYRAQYPGYFKNPATIRMNRLAPFKGRATDVDVVSDLMIHDIDLMVYLFNEIPKTVQSTGYKIRTDKWDYVCSEFGFSSGRRVIITVGRNHIKEIRDLEITNQTGCLYIDLANNEIKRADGAAAGPDDFVVTQEYSKRDHLLLEQERFYNSIKNQTPSIIGVDDGVLAIRLIDKVIVSLETNSLTDI